MSNMWMIVRLKEVEHALNSGLQVPVDHLKDVIKELEAQEPKDVVITSVVSEHSVPQDIGKIHRGDVVCIQSGADLLTTGEFFKVLRVHRKGRKLDVVDPDGRQFIRPLLDFTHHWSKEAATSLPLQWRF